MWRRILTVIVLGALTACTSIGPARVVPGLPVEVSEAPDSASVPTVSVPDTPAQPPVSTVRQVVTDTQPHQILVLLSSSADSYARVAAALGPALGDGFRLHLADLTVADDGSMAQIKRLPSWAGIIAIGGPAAEYAQRELGLPIIFCQVFDYDSLLTADAVFGVEAVPPLELQLGSWKGIAADARTVGMIVRDGNRALIEEAQRAAAQVGLTLHHVFAKTDREALYQFKRMAQAVDGILIHPSSHILSPGVIQEILDYSLKHGVHSIVFDPALLDRGALLSVASDIDDVAATVARVAERVISGDIGDLDQVTPLSQASVTLNTRVVSSLGLVAAADIAAK